MKKLTVTLILASAIALTACSSSTQSSKSQGSIRTTAISYNTEALASDVSSLIISGTTDNTTSFTDDFSFESDDTLEDIDASARTYFMDGAYYIQTDQYMYRFQLNEQGLIESYIKYTLEA